MNIARILYPVDLSISEPHGLAEAASLARRFDAELLMAHVIDFPYPYMSQLPVSFDVEGYYRDVEEASRRRLQQYAERYGPGTHISLLIERGNPATRIVQLADEKDVSLVAMPTHGRRGLDRVLLGSVTETVSRLCERPVLTLPPGTATGPLDFRRILVPTDFSERSDRALKPAMSLAKSFGASVLLLHVVTIGDEDPQSLDWGFPSIPPDSYQAIESAAAGWLRERGATAPARVAVTQRMVRGFHAADEILRVSSEEGIDLVVMATHGHTGLMHALLGSTAGKVLRMSKCPVLTIRAH